MENQVKAKLIVENLGGVDNIQECFNCMTRGRFILKDKTKINEKALNELEFILGLNDAGEQYQLILGPGNAQKIISEINEEYTFNQGNNIKNNWEENKKIYKKESAISRSLKKIGEVFIPMIPGFIASGIFLGIANIILNVATANQLDAQAVELPAIYYLFHMIGMALYGYLAVFTGINTAKSFGGTEILGGIIGGLTLSTELPQLFAQLGFNQTIADSMPAKGGIFGVLFAVMFMSWIEKKIRKVIPGILDLIVTPILTLLITAFATIFGFMLFAGYLTEIINVILNFLVGQNGIFSLISGAIIAGFFLPLVTFGIHQGFTPIYINEIATNGATYIFPIAAMAGAGQVGAAIAIYFKAKKVNDKRMQKIISGAIIPGFLGVGEPLIYGVTLPLGKPFITAGMGAALGGAYIAYAKVGAVATGPSGLTVLPLIIPTDMLQYLLGLIISYIGGFIFTNLLFEYKKSN